MVREAHNPPYTRECQGGANRGWSLCLIWLLICLFPVSLPAQSLDLERLRRSVVLVKGNRGNSPGTGSIIKVDGQTAYILTARHVIAEDINQGRRSVQVELYPDILRDARLSQQRSDVDYDIAVLTVENLPSPPPPIIPWGDSDAVWVTQRVFALGHPRGGPGWAVTEGFISGLQAGKMYFSGTAVNRGNSGGPLLSEQGALVGMNQKLVEGTLGIALMSNVILLLLRDWVQGFLPVPPSPVPTIPAPVPTIRWKDGKEMLLVPEGWFEMGSTPEEVEAAYQLGRQYYSAAQKSMFEPELPRHRVWLEAFYMDRYEVTVGEYTTFLRATGRQGLPDDVATYVATYAPGAQYPVVGVSWDDAEAYCRWAGKQLPTEAQWEKAARGTDGRQFPWGNEPVNGKHANYCDSQCIGEEWRDTRQKDGYQYTAPVGSYPSGKSPYGIEDLSGNVLEWVQDWYADDYYRRSPDQNPVNNTPTGLRVLRGGGWRYPPPVLRATFRLKSDPHVLGPARGFRCVVRVTAFRP